MRLTGRSIPGFLALMLFTAAGPLTSGQNRTYPDKIRDYKVERTVVEIKKPKPKSNPSNPAQATDGQNGVVTDDGSVDQLIKFGQPSVGRLTPLGITFDVPIVVAPVMQKGKVHFLVFEDMVINGRSVDINEYNHSFELPNKDPLTLQHPLRVQIYLPSVLLAAIGEWTNSQETWPVTGRVYVFGKFKKSILGISGSFKRVVPVELNLTMRNPLREK